MVTLTKKYNDKLLVRQAERALSNDPGIDNSVISVDSSNGVVTLIGSARNHDEHLRAIEIVRRAYERLNQEYDHLEDRVVER